MSDSARASNVTQALHDQAEARSMRATAFELETRLTPDPLAAEFMRYDFTGLETCASDALALDTSPPAGADSELVSARDQIKRGANFIDMVGCLGAVTAEASMNRLKLIDEGIPVRERIQALQGSVGRPLNGRRTSSKFSCADPGRYLINKHYN